MHAAPRHAFGAPLALAVLCGAVACKQAMVVGEFACPEEVADGARPSSDTTPVSVPWETGFENGRCDYVKAAGWCYSFPPATFRVVDSPVHSGRYAAEITVVTGIEDQPQGRCAREGVLPVEAYYGAWFFIPKPATNRGLWNLFNFRTRGARPNLWDVHLDTTTGALRVYAYSKFLPDGGNSPLSSPVRTGRWFHVVFYWKRANDTSGAVALYVDDQKVFESANLVTDDSDWGQWYAGNLASDMEPPECTVYMDDVTIRSTL
jgi:hypothetical protein